MVEGMCCGDGAGDMTERNDTETTGASRGEPWTEKEISVEGIACGRDRVAH